MGKGKKEKRGDREKMKRREGWKGKREGAFRRGGEWERERGEGKEKEKEEREVKGFYLG